VYGGTGKPARSNRVEGCLVSKLNDLSPKQRRFVEEYLIDVRATQAAIHADYSKISAHDIDEKARQDLSRQNPRLKIHLTRRLTECAAPFADACPHAGGGLLQITLLRPADVLPSQHPFVVAGNLARMSCRSTGRASDLGRTKELLEGTSPAREISMFSPQLGRPLFSHRIPLVSFTGR
jgi:Terminase small subunit